jgi:hypothetical protein
MPPGLYEALSTPRIKKTCPPTTTLPRHYSTIRRATTCIQLGVLQLGVLQFGVLQLSRLWLVGSFGLNFQADYGCLALKEPFLSLETSLPPKAFLALNSQADYGCPSRSHFLLKPILAATLSREPFFPLRDDH